MNKIYKPIFSLSRMFYFSSLNYQIVQKVPQKIFSEQSIRDMKQIQNIWQLSKNVDVINKYLFSCCVQQSDLLPYAIDIIHGVCNQNSPSPSLVFAVVKTFDNYIEENNLTISPSLEQNFDIVSSVLNSKSYNVVQLACKVFKFDDQPLLYKPFIKRLMQEQRLVDAAYLVSVLDLQKEFDIEEILLPLLLEGQARCVKLYIANHPDIQLKVVKLLDSYLDKNFKPIRNSESYGRNRKIFKCLTSLTDEFKIPIDNCPNLQFFRSKGAINILIKRRFGQSISEETFESMIKNIVGDDEGLKQHLVQRLISRKDMKTAVRMAEIFNVDLPELQISDAVDKSEESSINLDEEQDLEDNDSQNFDICDISDEYLQFPLKAEDIKVIDNMEDFINCLDDICQNYKMIGIDSEWKPHFGLSRDRLALIQIAVHDKVYILDLLLLSECLDAKHWDRLLDDIFGNPNLIKLGCGIMSDVNMILESIQGTKGKAIKFSHMLDMAVFYEKLQGVYPVEMQNESDKTFTRGLSSMCDIILGKPLNKENRLCDWEMRPLMGKQLMYAALDAHCLLQMYDKLKEEALKKEMNFEHQAKVAIVLTNSQWKPKRKFKGEKSKQSFRVHSLVPVEQLKVAIDSVFESQGKELRKLGADVVILPNVNAADAAVELSEMEERIIVCSDEMYRKVKSRVKEGFCYYLQAFKNEHIQVAHFLKHFNAQVSTKSMFSRCLSCNSDHGLKLSAEDVKMLHELGKAQESLNSVLQDNLSSFSLELQNAFNDILNSEIAITFSNQGESSIVNEFAFLCKSCGNIS